MLNAHSAKHDRLPSLLAWSEVCSHFTARYRESVKTAHSATNPPVGASLLDLDR